MSPKPRIISTHLKAFVSKPVYQPGGSWWVGVPDEQFAAAVKAQAPRWEHHSVPSEKDVADGDGQA